MMYTDGQWIKDEHGRVLLLRGANLSGSTKVPYTPDGATYRREGFYDHRQVSFVGRPFPLAEADEHFSRLRAWGMTFLRFLVTWEAIEHAGPGQYDTEYLDYLYAVLHKANEYGINVFIDPHQDVWSRWTGGDGAPGWTLEVLGIDLTRLAETGAAINHPEHGDPYPRMIWPTNYTKLGAGTLFTLFFGGNDFAPHTMIEGLPVQEYLQSHYINAVKQVALRLKDLPNVVGYDSLNEPGGGFIGVSNLAEVMPGLLKAGSTPTPYQAMLLGAGYPQDVDVYELTLAGAGVTGKARLNPGGVSLWREGSTCVWKQNGIWTDADGEPRLLRPDHFALPAGKTLIDDYIKPFIKRFITEIRSVDPHAILFLEGVPEGDHAHWSAADPQNAVNAGHWYDGLTLFLKQFNPEFTVDTVAMQMYSGTEAVQQAFTDQIGRLKTAALENMGGIPTLVGEFGLPYDMHEKSAYTTGDYTLHITALDMYYNALDAHLLNATIWNYTPDNTNARGDLWNDEDLSIFSRDQQTRDWREDIHSGGRALASVVRPYARATAGEPQRMQFDLATRTFTFEFRSDPAVSAPTEIFVPNYHYPNGYTVKLSDGEYQINAETQTLTVRVLNSGAQHTIRITPRE